MKMNKQRLSYSGRLRPWSICKLSWFLGTEEKKNNLEKTSQMVSTPGSEPGPHLFDIWVLSPLRHPCQRGYVRTDWKDSSEACCKDVPAEAINPDKTKNPLFRYPVWNVRPYFMTLIST